MKQDKIAIVTGANNGIGYETAIGMAQAGFITIMACRNLEKTAAARAQILERVPDARIEAMKLDLSDLTSVHDFAKTYRNRYDHLDVLINNAGILLYSKQATQDGLELQFATNHLGHFLLTLLLIDIMPDEPASRIVALSSIAHKGANIHFNDLSCGGNGGVAYGQSKLACLLFVDELNRRLKASNRKITALTVHPGGSDSGLFEEMSTIQYYALKILGPFITHSNVSASKPSLHAALDSSVTGGSYFGPQGFMELRGRVGIAKRKANSNDLSAAKRLWVLSEELCGNAFDFDQHR